MPFRFSLIDESCGGPGDYYIYDSEIKDILPRPKIYPVSVQLDDGRWTASSYRISLRRLCALLNSGDRTPDSMEELLTKEEIFLADYLVLEQKVKSSERRLELARRNLESAEQDHEDLLKEYFSMKMRLTPTPSD